MEREYKVVGYVRVASPETSSYVAMENQRNKLKSFVSEREDMQLIKIFTDCGASGLTLERNGLNELINYIHKNKIDSVIGCDVLRLGRNMVNVENFISENFTKKNVQFISISGNDNNNAGLIWNTI